MSQSLITAMVVEDDANFRGMTAFMLRRMGFRSVAAVEDAESAWTGLNFVRFDFILCDLGLGPMDGLELLRRVRASAVMADAVFMLMSANLSEEIWREAIKAGATEFLVKPFSWAELRDAVEVALRAPAAMGPNVVRFPRTRLAGRP